MLELEPTEDVLSALAARRAPGQLVVGFAAEQGENVIAYAREKLERKGLDAIVVNDISLPDMGFDAAENEVTILTATGGERHIARTSKLEVARAVLDAVEQLGHRRGIDGVARASVRSAATV